MSHCGEKESTLTSHEEGVEEAELNRSDGGKEIKDTAKPFTVAAYRWSIANYFVIDIYCRCLEILCQIAN